MISTPVPAVRFHSTLSRIAPLFLFGLSMGTAVAREFVLSDTRTNQPAAEWSISSTDLGIAGPKPFTIRQRLLHGGKQEGVALIEVDNGNLKLSVIPTRGMNVYQVSSGPVKFGWDSPVKEIVNPAFINLESRAGAGWLEGFNEFLVRCGVEWAGHPGIDNGVLLSLHGRIGNTPASTVQVVIDDQPPHRIRIRGRVVEQTFKQSDFELWTEISTEPGAATIRISDTLTNRSDYASEFQMIYHGNFSRPILESGSEFVAPVKQVTPFDDLAAQHNNHWTTYLGPTPNFGEQVYMVVPYSRPDGGTAALLRNQDGTLGVQLHFNVNELPYLSLWKNTDTLNQGYVTGLEPGTGFPYSRAIERRFHRVPHLGPQQSRSFTIDYSVLATAAQVAAATREIDAIRAGRNTQVDPSAPALEPDEGKR